MAGTSTGRYFEGFFLGGCLGLALGFLAAPKPGAELRKELGESYKNLLDTVAERRALGRELKTSGKELVDNFMGNNSGPVYSPGSKTTGSGSSMADAHSTYSANQPGAGGG